MIKLVSIEFPHKKAHTVKKGHYAAAAISDYNCQPHDEDGAGRQQCTA